MPPATVSPTPKLITMGMKVVERSRLRIDMVKGLAWLSCREKLAREHKGWRGANKALCTVFTIM